MTEGTCSKGRIVYGVVTVSDKGQISIPVDLRRDLDITQGDMLMILKRRDEAGFTLIKLSEVDDLMNRLQDDDRFLVEKGGE